MRIAIRTDSSSTIGSGHLMRCLTIAGRLHRAGAEIAFICRDLPGSVHHLVEKEGIRVYSMQGGNSTDGINPIDDLKTTIEILKTEALVDRLIVDHYSLDNKWEYGARQYVGKIIVIDDLANRKHDCDILLDQNLYADSENRYNGFVSDRCEMLLGPKYAMLRDEFSIARKRLRHRNGSINRIMISMGGADPQRLTATALEAIKVIDRPDLSCDIVVGAANPNIDEIKILAATMPNCVIHHPAQNMAALMSEADLCIGAAGSTTWERCCLGLPTLFIASGDNEIEIAKSAGMAGIGKYLGRFDEVSTETIADELSILFGRPDIMIDWGGKAASLVDGRGADRVCNAIIEMSRVEVGS